MPFRLELTQNEYAIIDDKDADLGDYLWCVKHGYSVNDGPKLDEKFLHRVILSRKLGRKLSKKEYVDHVNQNKLDNRRCNLRLATQGQNRQNVSLKKNNSSGVCGVYFCKRRKRYVSRIKTPKKTILLGRFTSLEEAAEARRIAERKHFGEFSPLNEVDEIDCESLPIIHRPETRIDSKTKFKYIHKRVSGNYGVQVRDKKTKKQIWIGTFPTIDKAVVARDLAVQRMA